MNSQQVIFTWSAQQMIDANNINEFTFKVDFGLNSIYFTLISVLVATT